MQWLAIGAVVTLALVMSAKSSAASFDFLKLRALLESSGSAPVPTTIPDLTVIQLQDVGPKAIDFVIAEQKKGRDILVPLKLAKSLKVSDGTQLLSVNPVWTSSAIAGGVFVLLPRF